MAFFVVIAGDEKGRRIPLPDSGESVLGRGIADVNFADGRLSRRHCAVLSGPDGYILKDLDSTNGVFLNGDRVTERPISHGDKIRLGYTVLEFSEYDETDDVPEPGRKKKRAGKTKIMAAKHSAMGKEVSDSRKLISAKGRFCEGCSAVIDPQEFEDGAAKQIDGLYLCPGCVLIVEQKGISPGNVAGYRKWKEQEKSAAGGGEETTRGLEPIE